MKLPCPKRLKKIHQEKKMKNGWKEDVKSKAMLLGGLEKWKSKKEKIR